MQGERAGNPYGAAARLQVLRRHTGGGPLYCGPAKHICHKTRVQRATTRLSQRPGQPLQAMHPATSMAGMAKPPYQHNQRALASMAPQPPAPLHKGWTGHTRPPHRHIGRAGSTLRQRKRRIGQSRSSRLPQTSSTGPAPPGHSPCPPALREHFGGKTLHVLEGLFYPPPLRRRNRRYGSGCSLHPAPPDYGGVGRCQCRGRGHALLPRTGRPAHLPACAPDHAPMGLSLALSSMPKHHGPRSRKSTAKHHRHKGCPRAPPPLPCPLPLHMAPPGRHQNRQHGPRHLCRLSPPPTSLPARRRASRGRVRAQHGGA